MKKKVLFIFIMSMFNNLNSQVFFYKLDKNNSKVLNIKELSEWVSTESLFTEFKAVGLPFEEENYLPEITLQVENFIQTKTYKQKMVKEEQKREIDLKTGKYRNTELKEIESINLIKKERLIKVELSSWIDTSVYSCSSYYPYSSSVNKGVLFNQSKSCYVDNEQSIYYTLDGVLIDKKINNKTYTKIYERQSVGTKSTSFRATYSCPSGWIASTNSNGRCYTNAVPKNTDGSCPRGYQVTNNNRCANYIPMVYSCPRGYRLSGTRCYD